MTRQPRPPLDAEEQAVAASLRHRIESQIPRSHVAIGLSTEPLGSPRDR